MAADGWIGRGRAGGCVFYCNLPHLISVDRPQIAADKQNGDERVSAVKHCRLITDRLTKLFDAKCVVSKRRREKQVRGSLINPPHFGQSENRLFLHLQIDRRSGQSFSIKISGSDSGELYGMESAETVTSDNKTKSTLPEAIKLARRWANV